MVAVACPQVGTQVMGGLLGNSNVAESWASLTGMNHRAGEFTQAAFEPRQSTLAMISFSSRPLEAVSQTVD